MVNGDNRTEDLVSLHFTQTKGYVTVALYATRSHDGKLSESLRASIAEEADLEEFPDLVEDGIPDFLVHSKDEEEWFFLEVKGIDDSIKENQIGWMKRYDVPVKLALADPERSIVAVTDELEFENENFPSGLI